MLALSYPGHLGFGTIVNPASLVCDLDNYRNHDDRTTLPIMNAMANEGQEALDFSMVQVGLTAAIQHAAGGTL